MTLHGMVTGLLLLGLGACSSLPSGLPAGGGVQVPTAWVESAASARSTPLARWWLRFNDPLLAALIAEALDANRSVKSAVAALRQARALGDVQTAGLGPSLGLSASAQRNYSGASRSSSNGFRAGLDAGWEPDLFGGQRAGVSAADADTAASLASLGDVQVSVAAELALNYLQLRGLQARLLIAQASLASQQETLQLTDWRAEAGLVGSLELEQARAAVAQTQAQLPALQAAALQTEHAIAVLTGQAPAALHGRLVAVERTPQASDDLVLAFPAETLRQRPDVRAAEARVAAAWARMRQADAARYPSFQLSGSLGLSSLALGSLTSGSSVAAGLLGSVSASLFDGGAARARVRAQEAGFDQVQSTYEATVLAALQEVEDALVALRHDRERLQYLRAAAESAQSAALLARQRYSSGLVDFQVVLETQRNALGTQDSVANLLATLNTDHVRLYKALGGGWVPDQDNTIRVSPAKP
ncbi:efflux transporter outer membrane subunit [Roseateles toxinivorans]|uniref:NodT family efflux transporter outer membrane factor (OMF) lipoprotein n=1 Tax=Roseateles toxinivorans TaxID=270368 RepID=A0A4R6QNC6_9BURK|nr:efflux transporter outer membrane subunit [Roseateles toxinivorans]TDP71091.1 NodT family efflux transporter outer membrane factor (OMF) lipoprotein [Roseateles toxinivorans]